MNWEYSQEKSSHIFNRLIFKQLLSQQIPSPGFSSQEIKTLLLFKWDFPGESTIFYQKTIDIFAKMFKFSNVIDVKSL
jgi:hypothetical protein